MRMSHTDKDRPWWVQNYQDSNGNVDHDHRSGECIEETLYHLQHSNGGHWRAYARQHKNCKKIVRVDFTCHPEKINGKRQIVLSVDVPASRYGGKGYNDVNRKAACWRRVCDCGHNDDDSYKAWREWYYCDKKYSTQCFGHWYTYRDNSISCVCDTWPEQPTCSIERGPGTKGGWRRYTWGGVPTEFVRRYYHRPERARERNLTQMAREYNAYGDIEDDDFVNRQARNSCRWLYW
jgi:hypothetical protein